MKINTGVPLNNDTHKQQYEKKPANKNVAHSGSSSINNEVSSNNFTRYNLSSEDSNAIMDVLKNSLKDVSDNLDNIFSNIDRDNVFSLLKENV